MKHVYKAFYGALLVLGLAGVTPVPALANGGSHWDTVCNCMRPDSEYNTRRYVREAPRVHTHQRIVNHTNVVKRTKLRQENRRETVNRYVRGSVRVVNEYRNVRGVNCNCGYGGRGLIRSTESE